MSRAGAGPAAAAYVLHSYDWSESSLIVELFTRAQGRVVVVAKGAKRPTSNFRAMLMPFHPLQVWFSKPGRDDENEVRNLRAAEWGGGVPLAPALLMSGFYLNELLLKGLARQDPHEALFDAYAETLAALAAGGEEAPALRAFELIYLRELGWLPELDGQAQTATPLAPATRYALRAEVGLVPADDGLSGATWLGLQAALHHGHPAALRQACGPVAAALRTPLRGLVHYHLGTAQLRTRQVGLELQRLSASGPR